MHEWLCTHWKMRCCSVHSLKDTYKLGWHPMLVLMIFITHDYAFSGENLRCQLASNELWSMLVFDQFQGTGCAYLNDCQCYALASHLCWLVLCCIALISSWKSSNPPCYSVVVSWAHSGRDVLGLSTQPLPVHASFAPFSFTTFRKFFPWCQ